MAQASTSFKFLDTLMTPMYTASTFITEALHLVTYVHHIYIHKYIHTHICKYVYIHAHTSSNYNHMLQLTHRFI